MAFKQSDTDTLLKEIVKSYSATWYPNPRFAYAFWLAGHIAKGGQVSFYGEPECEFVPNNSVLLPAHGAKSSTFLIQPEQTVAIPDAHSHNRIYDMRTFTAYNQGSGSQRLDSHGITNAIRDQIQMYRATREAFEARGILLNPMVEALKTHRDDFERKRKHLESCDYERESCDYERDLLDRYRIPKYGRE